MKNKSIFTSLFAFTLVSSTIIGLSSCTPNDKPDPKPEPQPEPTTVEVVDTLGRKVTAKAKNERILCIGASALRLYSYVGDMTKLCGAEAYETGSKDRVKVRPYNYAYRDLFNTLPKVATGGPMQPANAEAIAAVKPDLVFSLYNDVEKMNKLQSTINTPVVCLSYGKSDPFSNDVYRSLELIGQLSGTQERAKTVTTYIKNLKADLNNRTKDIPDAKKKSVYLGYNTYNGGHGAIGDTLVNYTCFKETNAKNVLKSPADFGGVNNPTLQLEKIVELNPEVMFIDVMNYNKLVEDWKGPNRTTIEKISAFKNGEVYIQMPFNQYYTNIDIAMADCYFVGKTIFPEQFKDVNVETKYNEILSTLLNKEMDYYARTKQDTKFGFGKVDFASIK